jgi:expansin
MKNKTFLLIFLLPVLIVGCKKDKNEFIQPDGEVYGEIFTGGEYHLGPVDWEESEWSNAFGPYPQFIQTIEGNYLAGLELEHNGNGEICDACVKITTEKGKSLIVRVITTGATTKNSIDVSPEAYEILNSGEYPRYMSWYVTKCPPNGKNIYYQFKTGSHEWWTALWARNIALPLKRVEVKNQNHSEWFEMVRESDGSYVDYSGFGTGAFSLRLTAIDGQVIEDNYPSYEAGGLLESSGQF